MSDRSLQQQKLNTSFSLKFLMSNPEAAKYRSAAIMTFSTVLGCAASLVENRSLAGGLLLGACLLFCELFRVLFNLFSYAKFTMKNENGSESEREEGDSSSPADNAERVLNQVGIEVNEFHSVIRWPRSRLIHTCFFHS